MLKTTDPFTIEAVIRKAIKNTLFNLHTAHPCKVKNVRDNGTVDVDLMIHAVFSGNKSVSLPSITQLPVLYQGNKDIQITFPVNKGDEGLALFLERDISLFLENGETGPPNALRMHNLSDGVFMPTSISEPNRNSSVDGTLVMENKGTKIEITDGVIKITGDLEVAGKTTISNDVQINGKATVNDDFEVNGKTTVSDDIETTAGEVYSTGPNGRIGLKTHKHPQDGAPPIPGG